MVYCVFVACLGSFSNGWVIGSPNVPGEITHNCPNGNAHIFNKAFPDCIPMDNALWGFAVASFCVGGLIGGLTAGSIQTRIGRKKAIIVNNLGYIIGGILIGTAVHQSMFILGRILCGIGCGMGSLSIPTYIGEVSTIKARGAMGTCNQFFIVIGILLSSIIGLPLATVPLWRINFAIVCIPAIAQFFLMSTCVETPRYLVSVNRIEDARHSLQKLRGDCDVEHEFYDMVEGHFGTAAAQSLTPTAETVKVHTVSDESTFDNAAEDDAIMAPISQRDTMNIIQIFVDPVIRRISFTVILLHAFQQLVGINAVMYYSAAIFTLAFDANMSKYMAIVTTVVNFVMTIVAVILIDRMGRRPLLLIGDFGACLFSILLVIGYVYTIPALLVVSVFLYVASFAIGIGPIPWLLTSELTPTYASSSVGSVATCVNWAMNFLIGQCFPVIFARIAGYSFAIFAVFAILAFTFTLIFLPETKGRSLESIVQGFERHHRR
ncbi:major facilitator superfamily domain-containing protein [Cokeromyces recurvatus]|uniref:major facilitator superfamily domain-containing protein n=1 Tax=Cokeromyces recurvatus TaxID=90255 RepID=UPI0022212266|nr:major facilitator superfamily domain-containing protein [Cokeromyces recurvatus]KAI7901798.1 major facilitator superfamily domain-containing protein [Cokeromyces recurvatus]